MANGNGLSKTATPVRAETGNQPGNGNSAKPLHPAWSAFVRYCQDLRYGEIGCLKIQDGLPVLAEVATRKIKFT